MKISGLPSSRKPYKGKTLHTVFERVDLSAARTAGEGTNVEIRPTRL
jgi:hypothetical protein